MRLWAAFLLLTVLSSGCARYEYNITVPPEFVHHIGTKVDVVFQRDSLEYRLVTYENDLVIRVYNPGDTSMTFAGEKSFAVDPSGQSHPLQAQIIAPHSFIKLILPPPRPQFETYPPTLGVGMGTMIGSNRAVEYGWNNYDDFFDEPRYFTAEEYNSLYWDWKGESEVRLSLVFRQDSQTLTHDFTIARKKVD